MYMYKFKNYIYIYIYILFKNNNSYGLNKVVSCKQLFVYVTVGI